ncbi:MAG: hypothetical protein ACXIT9_11010 [Nitritalea sp.]
MKSYTFLFILLLLFSYSKAQSPAFVSGYYVTNANDTVKAQIELPKYIFSNKVFLLKFAGKVELIDADNKKKVFKVNDIRGFGFVYDDNTYQYVSKDFGKENAFSARTDRFYQVMVLGQKSNLYHRLTTVDTNENILGIMYFLEKPNSVNKAIYLYPQTKPEFIRDLLKEFYDDNKEIHQLIDDKFQNKNFTAWHNEIIEIVQASNK